MKTLTRQFVEAIKNTTSARGRKVEKVIEEIEKEERKDAGTAITVIREACALLGIPFKRTCLENQCSTILRFDIGKTVRTFQYCGHQYKYVCTTSAICSMLGLVESEYWETRSYRWSRAAGMWDEYIPMTGSRKGCEKTGYFLFLRALSPNQPACQIIKQVRQVWNGKVVAA